MAETGEDRELQSRPPESRTAPWLVIVHGRSRRSKKKVLQTFYSVSEGTFYVTSIPEMRKCRSWATPQGWLLMEEPSYSEWYLLNPATMEKIGLPTLDWDLPHYAKCTLSSAAPKSDPNCRVMCTDFQEKPIFLCDIKDNRWIQVDAGDNTPLTSRPCNGYFYGIGVSTAPPEPSVRILEEPDFSGKGMPVGLFAYECFLVESCGEMFYVRASLHRACFGKRVHFDVWRRDSYLQSWSAVDDIGDRVFFLGTNWMGASCSAAKLGVKGNCIYYIVRKDKCIYSFDMEEGSITARVPCPHVSSKRCRAFWIVPSA